MFPAGISLSDHSNPATSGDDFIEGHAEGERINGKGGDDQIYGLGGRDILKGAAGDDHIHGGDDADDIQWNKGW